MTSSALSIDEISAPLSAETDSTALPQPGDEEIQVIHFRDLIHEGLDVGFERHRVQIVQDVEVDPVTPTVQECGAIPPAVKSNGQPRSVSSGIT